MTNFLRRLDHRAQSATVSLKGHNILMSMAKMVTALPVGFGISFGLLFLYGREKGVFILAPTRARPTLLVVSRLRHLAANPTLEMLASAAVLVAVSIVAVLAVALVLQPLPVLRHSFRRRRSPARETLWGLPLAALSAYLLNRFWPGPYLRCYIFSLFPTVCALGPGFDFAEALLGGLGAAMWGHAAKRRQYAPPEPEHKDVIPLKKSPAPPPDKKLLYQKMLGLGDDPSLDSVRKAYLQRAKQCQVTMAKKDPGLGRSVAERQMKELDEAYEFLLKSLTQAQESKDR